MVRQESAILPWPLKAACRFDPCPLLYYVEGSSIGRVLDWVAWSGPVVQPISHPECCAILNKVRPWPSAFFGILWITVANLSIYCYILVTETVKPKPKDKKSTTQRETSLKLEVTLIS